METLERSGASHLLQEAGSWMSSNPHRDSVFLANPRLGAALCWGGRIWGRKGWGQPPPLLLKPIRRVRSSPLVPRHSMAAIMSLQAEGGSRQHIVPLLKREFGEGERSPPLPLAPALRLSSSANIMP
jgi:hypothetical protein